ncbi:hypothetical protein KAI56_05075 [Candidatus Parcubacteria bacterium]|nr:hypothetical protein [Candidatus Parcubacteria bacterium]
MTSISIIGLALNLFGTIIIIIPVLCVKEWLNDKEIIEDGKNKKGEPWAITKGRKNIRYVSLTGLILIALGFVFQIISIICSS